MISVLRVGGLRVNCLHLPYPAEAPLLRRHSPPPFLRCTIRLLTTSCTTNNKRQKVIVISGPTGAGKSRLALELAKRLNGEIISADSVQVYKGLDIGSAKPSLEDRQEVPHHLVDILHPSEEYSVGTFYEDARQKTEEILLRDRVPIVTGGTGLYLRWFIYGKPDVPKASPEITMEVNSELADLQRDGHWDAALQLVAKAGDPGVESLAANDWYRLRRRFEILKVAYEYLNSKIVLIMQLSGASPSAFQVPYNSFKKKSESSGADMSDGHSNGDLQEKDSKDLDYDFVCFFLSTQRLDLYRSIDFRCEDMLLDDGILLEAKWLLDLGLIPNSNSATRAIGYRQAMDFLLKAREQRGCSSPRSFYNFLTDFQKASRNFAKRQLTWFRNEPMYKWIDASRPMEKVLSFIYDAYEDQSGNLEVPKSLCMEKDITNPKDVRLLKAYRPRNRHFLSPDDCSSILEWVRRTQGEHAVSAC